MQLTRTQFIGGTFAAAVGSILGPRASSAQTSRGLSRRGFSLAKFTSLLQTSFRFQGVDRGRPSDLVLTQAVDRGSNARTEQFSLEFLSPGGVQIPAGTYPVEHADLGSFSLYITPARNEAGGRRTSFRADFNLIR